VFFSKRRQLTTTGAHAIRRKQNGEDSELYGSNGNQYLLNLED
jgi:hypothetical protein